MLIGALNMVFNKTSIAAYKPLLEFVCHHQRLFCNCFFIMLTKVLCKIELTKFILFSLKELNFF
jgi:hypothetical protein